MRWFRAELQAPITRLLIVALMTASRPADDQVVFGWMGGGVRSRILLLPGVGFPRGLPGVEIGEVDVEDISEVEHLVVFQINLPGFDFGQPASGAIPPEHLELGSKLVLRPTALVAQLANRGAGGIFVVRQGHPSTARLGGHGVENAPHEVQAALVRKGARVNVIGR
jgi:hypothetical protein